MSKPNPVPAARKSGTWLWLAAAGLLLCVVAVAVVAAGWLLLAQPQPVLRTAWISGVESCPSHPDFGQQVTDKANLYRSRKMLPPVTPVPHGARVEVLEEDSEGLVKIRFQGRVGYVQAIFIVDYDPAQGVRPDETHCF